MADAAKYRVHWLCECFPELDAAEFQSLRQSVKQLGFLAQHPIWAMGREIVEGRHRWRAAMMEGVEPVIRQLRLPPGVDLLNWVLVSNLSRRNLTATQRAAVAAEARRLWLEKTGEVPTPKSSGSKTINAILSDSANNIGRDDSAIDTRNGCAAFEQNTEQSAESIELAEAADVSLRTAQVVLAAEAAAPGTLPRIASGEVGAREAIKIAQGPKISPTATPQKLLDKAGRIVEPRHGRTALEIWSVIHDVAYATLKGKVKDLATAIGIHARTEAGRWLQGKREAVEDLVGWLRRNEPWAMCPVCLDTVGLETAEPCKACEGRAWIARGQWDLLAPKYAPKKGGNA